MDDNTKKTSTEPSCKLTMFPANEGDCFLLEFGTGKDTFRMMIDSGTVGFGNNCLKKYLKANNFKKDEKMIDLLLITHFDRDHIGGALSILRDPEYCGLIKEVWHNGLNQIDPNLPTETDVESKQKIRDLNEKMRNIPEDVSEADKTKEATIRQVSAKQSESLSKLIALHKIRVNSHQNGGAIVAGAPMVELGPKKDVKVFFLLPRKERLDVLVDHFKIKLGCGVKASKMEECEALFEKISLRNQPESVTIKPCAGEDNDISNLEDWLVLYKHDPDTSQTNASSIAIIIQYGDKQLLFPGDAWGRELSDALKEWQRQETGRSLKFDVVKLPHHGSSHNCMELLDTDGLDGKLFLVSTDGEKHGHPNKETLAKTVIRSAKEKRILAFNYTKHARYGMFSDAQAQQKYHYCITADEEFPEFEVKDK